MAFALDHYPYNYEENRYLANGESYGKRKTTRTQILQPTIELSEVSVLAAYRAYGLSIDLKNFDGVVVRNVALSSTKMADTTDLVTSNLNDELRLKAVYLALSFIFGLLSLGFFSVSLFQNGLFRLQVGAFGIIVAVFLGGLFAVALKASRKK